MKEIKLYRGQIALVDESNFEALSKHSWWAQEYGTHTKIWYAVCKIKGKNTYMHRLITEAKSRSEKVDHINSNGLDNRKENLRLCSHRDNIRHKRPCSGKKFKGVRFDKREGTYSATICVGSYKSEEEAARAYDKFAKFAFGEFAYLNFP